jgi:homocysteine S-methyltransferase
MQAVAERLRRGGLLLLDGGLSTQLERAGADLRDALWSARLLIDEPDAIRAAHRAFLDAGADVVITASYQASFEGFAARGLDATEAATLMRRSVSLARRAVEDVDRIGREPALVAASVGPFGAVLADGSEYTGAYGRSVAELTAFHERRLRVLWEAEPDLLAIETIPSLDEARAVLIALSGVPDAVAWCSFTCRDGSTLADGSPFEAAVATVAAAPAILAIGVNCTHPGFVPELVRRAAALTDRPIVAYPNRGARWDPAARRWVGEANADLGEAARTWRAAGAGLIGGCCGTDAEDIAAIRRRLAERP